MAQTAASPPTPHISLLDGLRIEVANYGALRTLQPTIEAGSKFKLRFEPPAEASLQEPPFSLWKAARPKDPMRWRTVPGQWAR